MRTTLTIDDDVARSLRQVAGRTKRSFKEIVNETLRRGLSAGPKRAARQTRFVVRAKACGFRPGIDHLKLNQLVDELAVEDFNSADHKTVRG